MPSHRYHPNPTDITFDAEANEVLVINLRTGLYFRLHGTAAQIWDSLMRGASVDQVVERLAHLTDAELADIEPSISTFVRQLEQHELIVAGKDAESEFSVEAPTSKQPFLAPELQVYKDVQAFVIARPITRSTRLEPATANIAGELYPDEAIVLNMARGFYYSMPGISRLVWDAISQKATVSELTHALMQHFEAEYPQIEAAVLQFLQTLQTEGLVKAAGADAELTPPFAPQVPAPIEKLPLENFRLDRYADMQNLLQLDPIHEVEEEMGWPYNKNG